MLVTLLSFFLAILLLVIIHEYGHFLVARCCGVKVLRFSFGFGKVLARIYDKRGTEYVFSALPLGGYVKMLDGREEEVPIDEKHLAFNEKPLWKRALIVLAGPLFNFLFAIFAFWLVAIIGIQSLAPVINDIIPDSLAAQAGIGKKTEMIRIDGKPVRSWRDVQYAILPHLGSDNRVSVTIKQLSTQEISTRQIDLKHLELDRKHPDLLKSIGIIPWLPTIDPVVDTVMDDSPAAIGGLKKGDRIIFMNGNKVDDWMELVNYVQQHPLEKLDLIVKRGDHQQQLSIMIGEKSQDGLATGFLGVRAVASDWPKDFIRHNRYGLLTGFSVALEQTWSLSKTTVIFLGRLLSGRLSLNNISGPVGIAKGAGDSARGGIAYYLAFLALVSISLGVLNLLPIPMLDGGHLVMMLVEGVRGKPLSDHMMAWFFYAGLAFIVFLSAIALSNDLHRLF